MKNDFLISTLFLTEF